MTACARAMRLVRAAPAEEEGSGKVRRRLSLILTGLTVLIVLAAIPSALQDTIATGRIYLLSSEFLTDLPKRLTGPGRLRFLLQPTMAILLGARAGWADRKAGRPPYFMGVIFHAEHRWAYLRSGLGNVRDLLALGIILDAMAQYLIYGQIHPGAALVVGPVLICAPYSLARGMANPWTRRTGGPE
jgi:hypothetical protein